VFTLGDNVYPDGTYQQFVDFYAPSWGRHLARTRPVVGNHEYNSGGDGYYRYFGAAAGDPDKGYYSYDAGAWHVVVLNSNCGFVSCSAGSAQLSWLRADLAAHPSTCTVAMWHHPRFGSSTSHTHDDVAGAFWDALYDAHADLVLNGHDHVYERFAPKAPTGAVEPGRGLREFIVGTGGIGGGGFGTPQPGSEVRNGGTRGVLKLTLHPTSYDFEFVPTAGASFSDSGSGTCVT
jgi:hypothetical protein